MNNILIQAIGLIGTALFFLSFQCKSNKNLFRVQFLSYLFYTIHLILLGAITGGISYIINTFRSFCLGSKIEFARSKKMCVIISIIRYGWKNLGEISDLVSSIKTGTFEVIF